MNQSKISIRYSKALFELAKEQNKLDQIKNDIDLLLETLKIKDFKDFINSPVIPVSKKKAVFKNLFEKNIDNITLNTLLVIAQNRRETHLQLICLDYLKFYRDYLGITEINLTTAVELSDESKQKIIYLLKEKTQEKIDLKINVEPDIIGGFIVRVDDNQLDASIKGQLNQFKKQLTNS